jgi:S-phase kinase-associated protein 1
MSGSLNGIIEEQEEEDIGKQDTKLQNVSGVVLKRVVDFCTHYQEEAMNEVVAKGKEKLEEIVTQKWYLNFIKSFNGGGLFLLIQATNYLDIQSLLSLSVLALCDFINNKSEDMIRETCNITKPETSGR